MSVPPGWAHGRRALTPTFDEWGALVIALAWVTGLLLAVALI